MIRVLSLGFAERSLLKGFTGAVTDLAFAHLDSSLLGCVDEAGNLMVWQLTCSGNKILYPSTEWKFVTEWSGHCVCCYIVVVMFVYLFVFNLCVCVLAWPHEKPKTAARLTQTHLAN